MAKKVEIKTVISADDQTKTSLNSATQNFENFSKKANTATKNINSSFKKTNNSVRPMTSGIQQASGAMGAFKGAVVGVIAVKGLSMFKNMASAQISLGDSLAKNSDAIGMSVESLQALNYAADRQGVSTEFLYSHLKKWTASIGDLQKGQGGLYKSLAKNNPALLEQLKNAKDSEEAFLIASDAIKKLPDASSKASLASLLFTKSGVELNKMLGIGSEEIKKLMNQKLKYGVITSAQAKQSEELQDGFTKMQSSLAGVTNTFMAGFTPSMLKATQAINSFFEKHPGLINGIVKVVGVILPFIAGLVGIKFAFKGLKMGFTLFTSSIKMLTGIVPFMIKLFRMVTLSVHAMNAAFLANPVVAIVVGIIVVIAIVVAVVIILYKKFDGVRKVVNAIGRALKDFFMPIITMVSNLFSGIVNTVKKLWSLIGRKKKVSVELEAPKVESTPLKAQEQEGTLAGMHNENRSQTTIDVNFQNLPKGVMITQSPPVAGITLNLGYSG